jgi:hypothetical protein
MDQDTCDRCGRPGKVSVGYEDRFGYDGLCDACLDYLYDDEVNRGRGGSRGR